MSTLQLTGHAFTAASTPVAGVPIEYRSLTPSIVTVNSSGLVTAQGLGTGIIRVNAGRAYLDYAVTVTPDPTPAYFTLDWRPVVDRNTPRILPGLAANGPVDRQGVAVHYVKDSTTWGVTHARTDLPWNSGTTLVSNGGRYYTTAGVLEDARYTTGTAADQKLEARVNTSMWQSVKAHPSGRFYVEVDVVAPAAYSANSAGQFARLVVAQPGGTNTTGYDYNPFLTPLDVTQGVILEQAFAIPASATGYTTIRSADLPISAYTGLDDVGGGLTNLYVHIRWPQPTSGTVGIQTTIPRIVGGRTATLVAADNGMHAPIDATLGKWACNLSINCALWSDDFTNGAWSKSGVTVTAAQGNCPDFADTGSQWSRLAFTSGSTLSQTVALRYSTVNTLFVPNYVWVHLPVKQDGVNALPADGDLIADVVGTVGTTSANMIRGDIDGHVFYRARVPYKATNAGESNTSPVVKIRAKSGTTPQVLAVRVGVEPEPADSTARNVGVFALLVPPKTTTAAVTQSQTEAKIMRGTDMITRAQGFFRGRVALPWNPLTMAVTADGCRLGYTGPAANQNGFDPKINNPSGTPQFSAGLIGLGGNSSDVLQIPLQASHLDTTTIPGLWIFDWAVRWTGDHFDGYWLNGVKGIPSYVPGAGTTWTMPTAPSYGPVDCDNVNALGGFELIRQSGTTYPSDAIMTQIVATR